MATYVNDLRLTELATGEGSGTWGTTTNVSLELIGEALGYATQQVFGSDADATTTIADGASDPARAMYFKITSAGSLTATRTCTIAPNTVSRVMFIENATTGSQSISISQGSGANVTILTGKTAVVYLDGAGSGAAVIDAMAGVDPGVTDTLAEVLTAGNTTTTDQKIQFRDAAIYINSSADGQLDIVADTEIQIAATTIDINGAINASGEIIAASLDISGDIDVDGTTNLDVVDIDGAVDFASTTAHAGNATFADNAKAIFGAGSDLQISHTGTYSLIADTSGTGPLRVVTNAFQLNNAADTQNMFAAAEGGAVTLYYNNAAKLATTNTGIDVTGSVNADGGITVDNFTLDGTTLALSSGNMTLDSAGEIILDASDGIIRLKDDGTEFGKISQNSNNLRFFSSISDADILFQGNDGGSSITALTLDMSNAGRAFFNVGASFSGDVAMGDSNKTKYGAGEDLIVYSDGTNGEIEAPNGNLTLDVAGDIILDADGDNVFYKAGGSSFYSISNVSGDTYLGVEQSDKDLVIRGNDGGSSITALTLDMSAAGAATFNSGVQTGGLVDVRTAHTSTDVTAANSNTTLRLLNSGSGNGIYNAIKFSGNQQDMYIMSFNNATQADRRLGFFVGSTAGDAAADERLSITGDGNLGLGTTTPTNYTNRTTLAVNDVWGGQIDLELGEAVKSSWKLDTSQNTYFGTGANDTRLFLQVNDTNIAEFTSSNIIFNEAGNDVDFRVESNDNANMLFVDGGNNRVGIGTPSPSYAVDIQAQESNNAIMRLLAGTNGSASIRLQNDAAHFDINCQTNDNFAIYDQQNGRQPFTITAGSAALVINEDSKDMDFRVETDATSNGFVVNAGTGAVCVGRAAAWSFGSNTTPGFVVNVTTGRLDISADSVARITQINDATGTYDRFYRAGSIVGSITTDGSNTAYNTSSDQRLKKNIADADDSGELIDAIQVRQFDWKSDGSHQDYGMVAQELQAVAPEAVSGDADSEEMMGVDYSKLVPMLIKEIQSLRQRVAQLEE